MLLGFAIWRYYLGMPLDIFHSNLLYGHSILTIWTFQMDEVEFNEIIIETVESDISHKISVNTFHIFI